nr:hypothetical protein [Tanacetum cinerariifolium]
MIAQITRITVAREWYLDSGATIHVVGSRNSFTTCRAVTSRQVMMANHDKADVCGVRTVQMKFTSGKTVTLHNVLHVPTISKSLVSVGKLDEDGFKIIIESRKVVITKRGLLWEKDTTKKGSEVENQLGKKIKILRSDRGGEYFTREFEIFCEEHGIKHERTSSYTPQQNGLAERKNQTLIEMVNSYYRTPEPKRSKLGARGIKSVFVGYAKNSKAYRLLDENSGVIIESRDVEFFEDKFSKDVENPRASLVPTSTSSSPEEISTKINEPRRSTRSRKEKSMGSNIFSYLVEGTQKKVTKEESNVPFEPSVHLEKNYGIVVAQLEYASVIGCVMYATHCTMPDIAFVCFEPGIHVIPWVLEGYSDASWVNHTGDSISMSGWIYTLVGGAVSWASNKQTCISHSTIEAEFIALAAVGKEAEWMQDLLMDIHLWPGPMPSIPMYCDSQATLSKAYNAVYNGKSRHIHLRHNYVRQVIENGTISVVYVKSCRNLADLLTKPMRRDLVSVTTRDMGLKNHN